MKYYVEIHDSKENKFTAEVTFTGKQEELEKMYADGKFQDEHGGAYVLEKIVPAKNHHVCQYCGSIADGSDKNILCEECRALFGHAFYSEL